MEILTVILTLFALVQPGLAAPTNKSDAEHWSYGTKNVAEWKKMYKTCKGQRQSPINIETSKVEYDKNIGKLDLFNYKTSPTNMTLKNLGHTVQVDTAGEQYLDKGGLDTTYKLVQFHFHWASEHMIDSKRHPMEVHFVHASVKMMKMNFKEDSEGIAVLGYFFEISDADNEDLNPIIEHLHHVEYKDQEYDISPFPLDNLLKGTDGSFYRYMGGLTTPPCFESVVWTVFAKPLKISQTQLDKFKGCKMTTQAESLNKTVMMDDIYRTIQPLMTRKVRTNDPKLGTGTLKTTTPTSTTVALVFSYLSLLPLLIAFEF